MTTETVFDNETITQGAAIQRPANPARLRYNRFVSYPTVASITDMSVPYGRTFVLDCVSLDVNEGDVVAVRGANGVGTTTLLRVLVNAFNPRSGNRTGPRRSAYVPAAITPPSIDAGTWLRLMRP